MNVFKALCRAVLTFGYRLCTCIEPEPEKQVIDKIPKVGGKYIYRIKTSNCKYAESSKKFQTKVVRQNYLALFTITFVFN